MNIIIRQRFLCILENEKKRAKTKVQKEEGKRMCDRCKRLEDEEKMMKEDFQGVIGECYRKRNSNDAKRRRRRGKMKLKKKKITERIFFSPSLPP